MRSVYWLGFGVALVAWSASPRVQAASLVRRCDFLDDMFSDSSSDSGSVGLGLWDSDSSSEVSSSDSNSIFSSDSAALEQSDSDSDSEVSSSDSNSIFSSDSAALEQSDSDSDSEVSSSDSNSILGSDGNSLVFNSNFSKLPKSPGYPGNGSIKYVNFNGPRTGAEASEGSNQVGHHRKLGRQRSPSFQQLKPSPTTPKYQAQPSEKNPTPPTTESKFQDSSVQRMNRATSHQGESSAAQTDGPVVLGYYSADHAAVFPPEKVNYAALTHIAYAFASLESNGEVVPFKPETLKMIAYYAHQQNTKVLLSVGGWEHSKHFSTVVADDDWRSTFINSCTSLITEYDLDGIDLDWEFPGREGKVGNIFNPKDDVPNLLLALNEMRQAFDSVAHNKLITMAVTHDKLDGRDSIMAAFDRLVDFFNIMAYNSFGPWCDTTGPVAPTTNCKYTHLTAENAIDNWLHAGVPANKLVLGIPFYGYGSHVRENSYSGKIISPKQQPHSADDEKTWIGLRTNDILTGPETAKKPWTRNWDDASQTPWLYNSETGGFITYEDPISLKAKVDLAKSKGLRGVMVWALHHDNGELLTILQSMRK